MKNWFFWSSEIKYSLMLSLYFKLKLQKIRERRIYTLLSAGLNLSHMHVTHIHVTYLLLFNLHFYSSRYLSNIHIAQNRHSFTRLSVIQYNKRFLNLFEFIWTFEFSSTFFYHSHFFLFVIGSRFVSIITPYGKISLAKYSDQICQLSKLSIKILQFKWFYRYEGYSIESFNFVTSNNKSRLLWKLHNLTCFCQSLYKN